MKHYVIVKRKHLYTKERYVMFEGYAELAHKDGNLILEYIEHNQEAKVTIQASEHELQIRREAEMISDLQFLLNKKTLGRIQSEYGLIQFDIFTHNYMKTENHIVIEYDVIHQGEVSDGYQMLCIIKEELHE